MADANTSSGVSPGGAPRDAGSRRGHRVVRGRVRRGKGMQAAPAGTPRDGAAAALPAVPGRLFRLTTSISATWNPHIRRRKCVHHYHAIWGADRPHRTLRESKVQHISDSIANSRTRPILPQRRSEPMTDLPMALAPRLMHTALLPPPPPPRRIGSPLRGIAARRCRVGGRSARTSLPPPLRRRACAP